MAPPQELQRSSYSSAALQITIPEDTHCIMLEQVLKNFLILKLVQFGAPKQTVCQVPVVLEFHKPGDTELLLFHFPLNS